MAADVFGLDVAEADGHSQVGTAALRYPTIAYQHGLLIIQSATHGVKRAAEFDESVSSNTIVDAATPFGLIPHHGTDH
jgi:hypothetical protein